MRKKLFILFALIFLPITIVCFCIWLIFHVINQNKIHKFISNISINDIDAINGYQFEEIIAYILRNFGCKTTITKRSGDYGVDIFAKSKQIRYCIQTKLYYNHNVGSSAIQQINTGKNFYNCDYAVVVTNSYYTKQAIEMAEKLKVILINRLDLVKLLDAYRAKNKKFFIKLMEEKLCGNKYYIS